MPRLVRYTRVGLSENSAQAAALDLEKDDAYEDDRYQHLSYREIDGHSLSSLTGRSPRIRLTLHGCELTIEPDSIAESWLAWNPDWFSSIAGMGAGQKVAFCGSNRSRCGEAPFGAFVCGWH